MGPVPKSPLLKKRALDALLETMTTDDYQSLGGHGVDKGNKVYDAVDGGLSKGTEFEKPQSGPVVIPPDDLKTSSKRDINRMYHGSKVVLKDNMLRRFQGGGGSDSGAIFVTPDLDYAMAYKGTTGGLYSVELGPMDIFDPENEQDMERLADGYRALVGSDYDDEEAAMSDYEAAVGGRYGDLLDWAAGSQIMEAVEAAGFDGMRMRERPGTVSGQQGEGFSVSGNPIESVALFKGPIRAQRVDAPDEKQAATIHRRPQGKGYRDRCAEIAKAHPDWDESQVDSQATLVGLGARPMADVLADVAPEEIKEARKIVPVEDDMRSHKFFKEAPHRDFNVFEGDWGGWILPNGEQHAIEEDEASQDDKSGHELAARRLGLGTDVDAISKGAIRVDLSNGIGTMFEFRRLDDRTKSILREAVFEAHKNWPIEFEFWQPHEVHERFKNAEQAVEFIEDSRFGRAASKTAGHRVKDTGEYDEGKEDRLRRVAQETANYFEHGPQFDPKGDYLCKGCHYMLGNKACAFVEGDIDREFGACRYWKVADGKAPVELERKYSKRDAEYVERRPEAGFGCKRCEYGFEAKGADSDGRGSWCEFYGMHVIPDACCAKNSMHGDVTFNDDNTVNKQGGFVSVESLAKTAAKPLYHVTFTSKVPSIKAKGILPMQTTNWVKGDGERYGEGEIFACDNLTDAIRWGSRMDWEHNEGMGTGKISVVVFNSSPGQKWKTDPSDPMSQAANRGKWLKSLSAVKPGDVVSSHPITPDMVKAVVQNQEIKLSAAKPKCPRCGSGDYGLMPSDFETAKCNACGKNWDHGIVDGVNNPYEKTADVPTKSYGMGTPIGGTDNPDAGASDEPEELQDPGELALNMTSAAKPRRYYHATAAGNLNGIAEHGLLTSDEAIDKGLIENTNWGGQLGSESVGRTFLAPTPSGAMYYGEIVFRKSLENLGRATVPLCLRLTVPEGTDVRSDVEKDQGVRRPEEHFVEDVTIPPQGIEVWWQGKWQPLRAGGWDEMTVEYDEAEHQYVGWEGEPLGDSYDAVLRDLRSFAYPKRAAGKKALVEMQESPSLLPPRDDLKGHMDKQVQDQLTKEVMQGVRVPLNPKKRKRQPQIDPRINPGGVTASAEEQSEIRIRFKDREEVVPIAPEDIMKAIRQAEFLSMANPGFPVVFILDEAGIVSEDTYINGEMVGETKEYESSKTADYSQQDWERDEQSQHFLEQAEDMEDEAKRHFMQEDYLRQEAQDRGCPMEELWDLMGKEYTAEFYGTPYRRVPDFTDQEVVPEDPGKQLPEGK